MANDEERRSDALGRLTGSMRELAERAIREGRLPPALLNQVPLEAMETTAGSSSPLESIGDADALEAIIQLVGRPPMLVRNDQVELEPLPAEVFGADADSLIRGVEQWIPSVGRIEFVNHRTQWGGTGWVIGKDAKGHIVATNRHVAKIVATRVRTGAGVFMRDPGSGVAYGANIDFSEEIGSTAGTSRTAKISAIDYLADDSAADVALLRVAAAGFAMPTPFNLSDSPAQEGDLVALIGYPARDSRNDAAAQAQYFNDIFDVKRFAPGRVMQALGSETTLRHDCTSLGGNSGSPLISLRTGEVVGLHFSGRYGIANTAVGVDTLKRLMRGERPAAVAVSSANEAATTEAPDGDHAASELTNRDGYDPDFLGGGLSCPWPGLPDDLVAGLATPSDAKPGREHELRYTHFGVKYSGERKSPIVTAVNIDGEKAVRIKRGRDKWYSDGRIPLDIQLGEDNYKDAEIDRGHLVRREDPNWGSAAEAQLANDDTFHYVNASPQHSKLNQGKQLWQGLENYILDSARTSGFRACVFTGPILRLDDPEIDGAPVPQEYWKLVAMVGDDGESLHATAYLLSQGLLISELMVKRSRTEGMEGIALGEYRTFQLSVADLGEATGYDFSAYVDADPLRKIDAGREAIETGEPVVVPLQSRRSLVL